MKIKISKKTKRLIVIYIALLVVLYVVIYLVPKATGMFETTEILEPGTLTVSCETTGYLVKDETINIAKKTGIIDYKVKNGTAIKKGVKVAKIEEADVASEGEQAEESKYSSALKYLKKYDGLVEGTKSPISGIFSLCMDGYEKYFSIGNLDNISREKVEQIKYDEIDLEREEVVKGEPIFKICSDDNWYVVCWLERADAKRYDEGLEVTLEMPDGNVAATVYQKKKEPGEEGGYKIVFYSTGYYKTFASTRKCDMNIVISNNSGLIIDNECLTMKDGVQGVYVKNKNGVYVFKPVKVRATDGEKSVLADSTFVNEEFEQVQTVDVYDEVLKDPQSILKKEEKQ